MCTDPLVTTNRCLIAKLALEELLPTINAFRQYVEAGGLMSYGPNFPDLFRRAAGYVDRILHGANPATLPVQQPEKSDTVVNWTTATKLNLGIPEIYFGAEVPDIIEFPACSPFSTGNGSPLRKNGWTMLLVAHSRGAVRSPYGRCHLTWYTYGPLPEWLARPLLAARLDIWSASY